MMHLQGRVFTRLNHFNGLPTALQHEANALADHLTAHSAEVFSKHHALNLKSVYSVKAKHLLYTIDQWIASQHGHHVTGTTEPAHASNFPVTATNGPAPTAIPVASAGGHHSRKDPHHHGVSSTVPVASAGGHHSHKDHHDHVASSHAKTLLEALVLKGFITSHKEEKHVGPSTTEDLALKDSELLVPLSKQIKGEENLTTSVWDLVDGAVFAGSLKRKAGVLEPLTHGKDIYAVVNARCKTLSLFATDLSREPIVQLEAATLKVAFDTTRYDYGVKVWSSSHKELLNAGNQQESDALVHALLAIGATHDQRHFLNDQLSPSELHNPAAGAAATTAAPTAHHPGHMHHHQQQQQVVGENNGSLKHKIGNMFKKDDHRHADGRVHAPEPAYAAP